MTEQHRHKRFGGPELIAEHVGVITSDIGDCLPGDLCQSIGITPDGGAMLISISNWMGDKGLYTLFTPAGARMFAATLLNLASHAEKRNDELAADMLARTLGKAAPK